MKLFVYGLLKEGFALSSVLSRSKKLGNYTTKSKGLVMSGFSYPFVWENKYSKYNIKGELYEVNQSDLKHANFIELGAGYKLKEIDKDIFGYVYPKPIELNSSNVNVNDEEKYYEWRKL